MGTQLTRQPSQSSSQGNFFVRVRFGGVPSTVEKVVRVRFCSPPQLTSQRKHRQNRYPDTALYVTKLECLYESTVFHWEKKGRFCKRVVLANVPSFRFSFRENMRTYPRCGFHSEGTSELYTLVPVFVLGEHPPKPPFWKTTLLSTPEFCDMDTPPEQKP